MALNLATGAPALELAGQAHRGRGRGDRGTGGRHQVQGLDRLGVAADPCGVPATAQASKSRRCRAVAQVRWRTVWHDRGSVVPGHVTEIITCLSLWLPDLSC